MDTAAMAFIKKYEWAIAWGVNYARIAEADRPDAQQEIRLRIINRFRKCVPFFEHEYQERDYACTLAKNFALTISKRPRNLPAGELAETWGGPAETPWEQMDRATLAARVRWMVSKLPKRQRQIIERTLQGHMLKDTAKRLRMPLGTAKVYAHRARQTLREMW